MRKRAEPGKGLGAEDLEFFEKTAVEFGVASATAETAVEQPEDGLAVGVAQGDVAVVEQGGDDLLAGEELSGQDRQARSIGKPRQIAENAQHLQTDGLAALRLVG